MLRRNTLVGLLSVTAVTLAWVIACGSSGSEDGSSDQGAAGSGADGAGAGNGTGSTSSGTGGVGFGGSLNLGGSGFGSNVSVDPGGQVYCGDVLCACNDGMDNDDPADGLVDGFDPECTGPYDNDETSFATGIPGDNSDEKWQDCFFDGNSGAGDDGCRYHADCLTGDLEPTDPSCTVTEACVEFCTQRVSNGCDCFGCCEVQDGDASVFIRIGESCSLENIDDETACPRCEQSTQCVNTCGECELCPGKTAEDLPASCSENGTGGGSGGGYTCEGGVAVCETSADCAGGYCQLGCCVPIVK